MRPTAGADATSRQSELRIDLEDLLTHLCAAIALAYTYRAATFASTWISVPLQRSRPSIDLPFLSIIVPARNEERSIETCVRSLLAQEWIDFEVIVVDDCSADGTPRILAGLAREDARLRIVHGKPLPDGWVGKPWALSQGAKIARGSWLLFTDADSTHAPRGSASTLAFARHAGVDAVSIATHQELGSFWERATLPSVLGMILFATGPLGAINDPENRDTALANGQYIMVSRNAYDALGGHDALRSEIVEDLEFAKRLKADGRFRMLLAGGSRIASVRMYHSLSEIWAGFSKNIFIGAKGDLGVLCFASLFLMSISIAPIALVARAVQRNRAELAVEALLVTATVVAASSWGMRRAAFSGWLAPLQPLGTAFLAAVTLNSAISIRSGRGVTWRDRQYFKR